MLLESTTFTVKLKVPPAVGVPLSTPSTPRDKPAGKAPALMLNANGVASLVAVISLM